MLDKAITLTRSELRAYDSVQLADLLTAARDAFREPARLAKAMKRGEETVRDYLRQVIWSVLAVQAEQKHERQNVRVNLLNMASRSKRQRQTVRVR